MGRPHAIELFVSGSSLSRPNGVELFVSESLLVHVLDGKSYRAVRVRELSLAKTGSSCLYPRASWYISSPNLADYICI